MNPHGQAFTLHQSVIRKPKNGAELEKFSQDVFLGEDERNVFHTLNLVPLAVSNAALCTSIGRISWRCQ